MVDVDSSLAKASYDWCRQKRSATEDGRRCCSAKNHIFNTKMWVCNKVFIQVLDVARLRLSVFLCGFQGQIRAAPSHCFNHGWIGTDWFLSASTIIVDWSFFNITCISLQVYLFMVRALCGLRVTLHYIVTFMLHLKRGGVGQILWSGCVVGEEGDFNDMLHFSFCLTVKFFKRVL